MALGEVPNVRTFVLALLYSAGAHGIMTLNDFKSERGDRLSGIGSLPVRLGVQRAARVACVVMLLPQGVVIALLWAWQRPLYALGIGVLVLGQALMMRRFLAQPQQRALWYSGLGVPLYVSGMLVSALALRSLSMAGA